MRLRKYCGLEWTTASSCYCNVREFKRIAMDAVGARLHGWQRRISGNAACAFLPIPQNISPSSAASIVM